MLCEMMAVCVVMVQAEFKGLKEEMLKEAQRGAKLEAKVGIVIKGHQDRHSKLDARLQTLCQQARSSATELACFRCVSTSSLLPTLPCLCHPILTVLSLALLAPTSCCMTQTGPVGLPPVHLVSW